MCLNYTTLLLTYTCLFQVGEKMLTRFPKERDDDGLESSTIGLVYPLSSRIGGFTRLIDAKNDRLQLKCTAKIGNAYWESIERETIIRRDGYMLESRSSGASGNITLCKL